LLLKPGESYVTRLVFDVPSNATSPRLLITESDWVTRLLLGHENSFLHSKTFLALGRDTSRGRSTRPEESGRP